MQICDVFISERIPLAQPCSSNQQFCSLGQSFQSSLDLLKQQTFRNLSEQNFKSSENIQSMVLSYSEPALTEILQKSSATKSQIMFLSDVNNYNLDKISYNCVQFDNKSNFYN